MTSTTTTTTWSPEDLEKAETAYHDVVKRTSDYVYGRRSFLFRKRHRDRKTALREAVTSAASWAESVRLPITFRNALAVAVKRARKTLEDIP